VTFSHENDIHVPVAVVIFLNTLVETWLKDSHLGFRWKLHQSRTAVKEICIGKENWGFNFCRKRFFGLSGKSTNGTQGLGKFLYSASFNRYWYFKVFCLTKKRKICIFKQIFQKIMFWHQMVFFPSISWNKPLS